MQLKRKQEETPKYEPDKPVYKKAPPINWSTHEIDWKMPIPHGKFKGATLKHVKENDDWYWSWIQLNNIIAEWGMVKLKGQVSAKKYSNYLTPDGEYWVDLRYVEEPCEPAQKWWYEQQ